MTSERAVEKSVRVRAPVAAVWRTITDLERIPRWLNGVRVETTWRVGEPIVFTGDWRGKELRERGMILRFEPEQQVQYGRWSNAGHADAPANRSVVTIAVEPNGSETLVVVRHEALATEADCKHANFHWGVSLRVLKDVIEGRT